MAETGEVWQTRNLVLSDVDESMMHSEGAGSYWPALLNEMAVAFPDHLTAADVPGGEGLAKTWYDLRGRAAGEIAINLAGERAPDLPDFNDWWERQPHSGGYLPFDPLNVMAATLNIPRKERDDWLVKLEKREPTLAQRHAFDGALDLWQALTNAPDEETIGHLLTKGGEVLQPHKVRELIGMEAMKHTTIIFGGNKGEMINKAYDADTGKYKWETGRGLIVADRVAIVEDSFKQVETLDPDREGVLAVLIMRGAVELERPSHPRMEVVNATNEVAGVLREHRYLPS